MILGLEAELNVQLSRLKHELAERKFGAAHLIATDVADIIWELRTCAAPLQEEPCVLTSPNQSLKQS
jgi:hypothetical protein